jgi:predicted phosphodiesterase
MSQTRILLQKRKAELLAERIGDWEEAVRLRKFIRAIEEETMCSDFSEEAKNEHSASRRVGQALRRHTGSAVRPSRGDRRVRSPSEQVLVAGVSISTYVLNYAKLGDFCMGGQQRIFAWRRRIHCKKIFAVAGNHDKQACKLKEEFSWLDNPAEVSIHGQSIVLCHYALRVCHSDGRLPEAPNSLSMDVGVDTHNFRPWHCDEIADIMTKKAEARESNRS